MGATVLEPATSGVTVRRRRLSLIGVGLPDCSALRRWEYGAPEVGVRRLRYVPPSFQRRVGVIELRPVLTDSDREVYVAVRNTIHPDTPITIDAHFSETRQDDRADLLAFLD